MLSEEQKPLSVGILSRQKQLAFALLIYERMLPSLIAFSEETGFDDSCYLRAKDAAWVFLQNGSVDQSLAGACLRSAPDTEEFSSELTSYALNAALAMNNILEFTEDGCADHITTVAQLAVDSVFLYLSSSEVSVVIASDEERRIAAHPLMQDELRREQNDISFLASLEDHFDSDTVPSLQARAKAATPLLPPRKSDGQASAGGSGLSRLPPQ